MEGKNEMALIDELKNALREDKLEVKESRLSLMDVAVLQMMNQLSIERTRDFLCHYNRMRPKVDLAERRKLILQNTSIEQDLDTLGRDSEEAKAFEVFLAYNLDVSQAPALRVLISQIIHPILERLRLLTEALANTGIKES